MLERRSDNWFSFAGGLPWRVAAPSYLCEVGQRGVIPHYFKDNSIKAAVSRIRGIYSGQIELGNLNVFGTGLDILVANAMTESSGNWVDPSILADKKRRAIEHRSSRKGEQLELFLRDLLGDKKTKHLIRFEPGYLSAILTPNKVSVGCHQMLLATALEMAGRQSRNLSKEDAVIAEAYALAEDWKYAGKLAVSYFQSRRPRHHDQIPMMSASYNAGSPVFDNKNPWHLRQYGNHIDKWIKYYNTSRLLAGALMIDSDDDVLELPTALDVPSESVGVTPSLSSRNTKLSAHFSLEELVISDIAKKHGVDNSPDYSTIQNLKIMAEKLEEVRAILGNKPIKIQSGYRSKKLNDMVGGAGKSAHLEGLAADFVCPAFGTPYEICTELAKKLKDFDQLIHENGRWVHLGLRHDTKRNQVLTMKKGKYLKGIHPIP